MRPDVLELQDFRNLAEARLDVAPRLTYLIGDNAQGKTNLLEALAYALTLRPLRAAQLEDLIRRGRDAAHLHLSLTGAALPWEIDVRLQPQGRHVVVNGKALREVSNLLGTVALAAYTPDDLELVRGGPEQRRRSLDRFVSQVRAAHLGHLRAYRRALRARNVLLQQGGRDRAALQAFDETLARVGAEVMSGRRHGVALLAPSLAERHRDLAPQGGELVLRYSPAVAVVADADVGALAAALRQALERGAARDLRRGLTGAGPHLDDVELVLEGAPARRFASQGQARTILMALRLAEVDQLTRVRGEGPVLIADDLLAELDDRRVARLLDTLAELGACVVASGTRLPRGITPGSADVAVVRVDAGSVVPLG